MSESLTTQAPQSIAPATATGLNLGNLFELAVTGKVDVGVIKELVALNEQMLAKVAEAEFNRAMAAFQKECPVIPKLRKVSSNSGAHMYSYAPLEDILLMTAELRERHGFTHSFDSTTDKGSVKAICIVTHEGGHTRRSEFEIPAIAASKAMNAAQAHASALSYGKRYAFIGAFGIQTGEDDDANALTEDTSKLGAFKRQQAERRQQEAQRGPVISGAPGEGSELRGPDFTEVASTLDPALTDLLTMIGDAKDGNDLATLLSDIKAMADGPSKETAKNAFVARRDALGYRYDKGQFVK